MTQEQITQLRQALIKDWNNLYKRGYATDWETKRLIRCTEIEIMEFQNVVKFIDNLQREERGDGKV